MEIEEKQETNEHTKPLQLLNNETTLFIHNKLEKRKWEKIGTKF